MRTRLLFSIVVIACLVLIGCGGDGVPEDNFTNGTSTSSTNGSTNGSTTGDEHPLTGSYDGFVEGGNTTGTRFTGDGFADIFDNGEADFWFDGFINNVIYSRRFEGRIDANGNFEGFTHTGERAYGNVELNGDELTATITWVKRDINGNPFYTESTTFSLLRI